MRVQLAVVCAISISVSICYLRIDGLLFAPQLHTDRRFITAIHKIQFAKKSA